jgi:phospholipid/cholesterol/gamma-HCH transport system substrate-binding protein
MIRTIREHLRDFIAIIALTVAGLVTAYIILDSQAAALPSWVPLLGEDQFELKAEMSSAQAVTPGQGQAVMVAGIQVGDITAVELEDGHAVVTMGIKKDDAELINEDASLLLRPKTGLNDMVLEVDPGTGEDIEEGETVPLASTLPNVNPDEFLAALDADTQGFLRLLLSGAAEGIGEEGRGVKLSLALRQFEPFARDISRISKLVAKRRANVARSIHNFRLLSEEIGDKDQELITFVDASNAVLQSFANQEAAISEAMRELPSTLAQTNAALKSSNEFAIATLPALQRSLPGARALDEALRGSRNLFRNTAVPIRDQIRPFVRDTFLPVKHLRQATEGLDGVIPPLRTGFTRLNEGLNALAYNPSGADESYLFYIPWLNHNTNSQFLVQDSHGGLRRGIVLQSCATTRLAGAAVGIRPFLRTVVQGTNLPISTTPGVC